MSQFIHDFDTDDEPITTRPGQLSANGHWIFGSIFGCLILSGLAFGVWLGAAKPKVIEVAEKPKETTGPEVKPEIKPQPQPPQQPQPQPQLPPDPTPKKNDNEPSGTVPDPKKLDPDPKIVTPPEPKKNEPEPKKVELKPVSFKQVEPILRAYCNNCHGDVGRPKGGVDLRTLAAIKKGGRGGDPIIVVGDLEKSPLYESITSGRMPDEGKAPPPPAQLEIIKNWILTGAKERRRPVRVRRGQRIGVRPRVELTPKADAG